MKRNLTFVFVLFIFLSGFGQEKSINDQLLEVSKALGVNINLEFEKEFKSKKKEYYIESKLYLLKAAEYYKNTDYESSIFYIRKAKKFDLIDWINLKYVILVGSYANLKDINKAAYYYSAAEDYLDPSNMRIIRTSIKMNFKKDEFYNALKGKFLNFDRQETVNQIFSE